MTLKELYEQTDHSKINQLKVYENCGIPKFIEITSTDDLRPYFDYLVIGFEPYIRSTVYYGQTDINCHAKLRVVISKDEEE